MDKFTNNQISGRTRRILFACLSQSPLDDYLSDDPEEPYRSSGSDYLPGDESDDNGVLSKKCFKNCLHEPNNDGDDTFTPLPGPSGIQRGLLCQNIQETTHPPTHASDFETDSDNEPLVIKKARIQTQEAPST
ncbi:unnamed protein product [Acanthoscelides obtectus]|uniref:Uncharacterized protein n=1 Tax=Acanthoscelides obtectus TaxID=200917 RepID=A0A9P0ME77_ACAOB|nr:unnamed protein product [Acanthoscelides obtectus]CAK1682894.1 hypothetical protein AOBTE_LOCUS33969 [Acanthoscelides obtectus]